MTKIFLAAALAFLFCSMVFAEGLDTLIEVGRDQAGISEALKLETENFEKVKRAVENGSIKIGDTKEAIRDKYGDPVVETTRDGKDAWVYKSADASFFEGVKIYLFFDGEGKFEGTKIVDQEKKPEDQKAEE